MTSRKHRFRPEVKEGRRPLSKKHPIIAVTGASGSGRGPIKEVFDKIFKREGIAAAFIDGASFHRYDRAEMDALTDQATALGDHSFSHFGPSANLLHELEALFARFAATGTGRRRHFLHSEEDARRHGCPEIAPGGFTPWEDLPDNAEVLLYEGFHGVVKTDDLDVGRHVDLKIGVTPIINLEWIRKVHRDTNNRGYSEEAAVASVLRRMHDYVHYIVPQFKSSDINFQQVPVVDTSDPLIARDIPTCDESLAVIRFRRPEEHGIDFCQLLDSIQSSWMSRRNTLVVPGGKMYVAMKMILTPIIARMMEERKSG